MKDSEGKALVPLPGVSLTSHFRDKVWFQRHNPGTLAMFSCCWGMCPRSSSSAYETQFLQQGVLGAMLIRLNVAAAVYRHNSYLRDNPVLEVVGATAFTAGISYLVRLP